MRYAGLLRFAEGYEAWGLVAINQLKQAGVGMWICLNDAFVSAVADKDDASRLCVRSRNRLHLETLFPYKEVVTYPGTDYACRVFLSKDEFAELASRRIANINYRNFKNSVQDEALHHLYEEFWGLHYAYQQRLDRRDRLSGNRGDVEFVAPKEASNDK